MIDFNIFPSIRLTKESAVSLLDTPSRDLVSSKYSSWKQILNDKYEETDEEKTYISESKAGD